MFSDGGVLYAARRASDAGLTTEPVTLTQLAAEQRLEDGRQRAPPTPNARERTSLTERRLAHRAMYLRRWREQLGEGLRRVDTPDSVTLGEMMASRQNAAMESLLGIAAATPTATTDSDADSWGAASEGPAPSEQLEEVRRWNAANKPPPVLTPRGRSHRRLKPGPSPKPTAGAAAGKEPRKPAVPRLARRELLPVHGPRVLWLVSDSLVRFSRDGDPAEEAATREKLGRLSDLCEQAHAELLQMQLESDAGEWVTEDDETRPPPPALTARAFETLEALERHLADPLKDMLRRLRLALLEVVYCKRAERETGRRTSYFEWVIGRRALAAELRANEARVEADIAQAQKEQEATRAELARLRDEVADKKAARQSEQAAELQLRHAIVAAHEEHTTLRHRIVKLGQQQQYWQAQMADVEQQNKTSSEVVTEVSKQLREANADIARFHYIVRDGLLPVRELRKARERLAEAKEAHDALAATEGALQRQTDATVAATERVRAKVRVLNAEFTLLEGVVNSHARAYTPRPDWSRVMGRVPELHAMNDRYERQVAGIMETRREEATRAAESALYASSQLVDGELSALATAAAAAGGSVEALSDRERLAQAKELLDNVALPGRSAALASAMCKLVTEQRSTEDIRNELAVQREELERALAEGQEIEGQLYDAMQLERLNKSAPGSQASSRPETSGGDYFTGLGTTSDVPEYLRFSGRIRNRHLTLGELLTLVRQVWEGKKERDRSAKASQPLPAYFRDFLYARFGVPTVVAEWAYSTVFALEKYVANSAAEMFLVCLTGSLSEEAYHNQARLVSSLKRLLRKLQGKYPAADDPVLHKDDVVATLRNFLPEKSEDRFAALVAALDEEEHQHAVGAARIDLAQLFALREDGDSGPFVEELRDQHLEELQERMQLLERLMAARDSERSGQLPLSVVREVFIEADDNVNEEVVRAQIALGLGIKPGDIAWSSLVGYTQVLKDMRKRVLIKPGRNFVPTALPALSPDSPAHDAEVFAARRRGAGVGRGSTISASSGDSD